MSGYIAEKFVRLLLRLALSVMDTWHMVGRNLVAQALEPPYYIVKRRKVWDERD